MVDPSAQPEPHEEALLAEGWQPVRQSAFTQLVGPFYSRRDDEATRFCFRVAPKHDNTVERAHGGMIMAFCDDALGLAAHWARPGMRLLTIGFECQFVNAAALDELVIAETTVTRATATLVFMRGICRVGDRTVATCSGIWKVVGPLDRRNREARDG